MIGITAFSSKHLSENLQKVTEWRSRPDLIPNKPEILWTERHISTILNYVLKLEGVSLSLLGFTGEDWHHILEPHNCKNMAKNAVSFTQDLRLLFDIPKLHQLSDHKKEVVGTFINFILQLLYNRMDSFEFFDDQIDRLQRELRFLVTVLEDKGFMRAEVEQVWNLLAEFEAAANDAGSLVHSFIFVSVRLFKSLRIDKAIDALLKRIDHLKENIIKFSNMLQFISNIAMMTPKIVSGDSSLFIIDSLLYDLEDLMNRDDVLTLDLKNKIEILHQELLLLQCLLKGIKASPYSAIQEVKETATQLRDVAFQAEYLINSFLAGNAPTWYLTIRLTDHIIHEIKLIKFVLQEIRKKCDLGDLKVARDVSARVSFRAKRSFEAGDIIVGFEENATNILDQLVGGRERMQMISIFGMPGLGKTTFAKKLYNHPLVTYRFDKLSWCAVSQTYHRKNMLVDVLMSLTDKFDKVAILNMEEESLVEHTYKSLKGRRYLIVMDDIWDSNAWDEVRRCFPDDRNGSRILLTTRNKDVAPSGSIIHTLPLLSNEQCWELLKKKVFRNKPCPPELQGIGKDLAANCWGLPLAVVVIAGVLSTMDEEESTWKKVGRKLGSYIFYGVDNYMMQMIELSYRHLSEYLKPCFLYFGVFPEDTKILARKLMRLWIAEGFIHKEEGKSIENVAEEYLMELIDRSLLMVAKRRADGGVKACVMHDLLREFCLKKSEEPNYSVKWVDNKYSIYDKGHRLQDSITPSGQHVRSLHCDFLQSSLYVLNMPLLRVLDSNRIPYPCRLIGTEFLVRLKYLVINDFPPSIGNLANLESLTVQIGIDRDIIIPSAVLKMVKLRYLHIMSSQARWEEDFNISQKTNNLEFLSKICINNLKDEEMLKCSSNLRKFKCICKSFWDKEKGAYRYPDLRLFTQLESLNMTVLRGSEMAEINLPFNIKKLTLSGMKFPWENMSIIGKLPNLEVLKLTYGAFMGRIWETRDGEFCQLRYLKLQNLDLAQWNVESRDHFPKLQQLFLLHCGFLRKIPYEIGEIVTLQLIEVGLCSTGVVRSARKIEQEQREMGNEELRIIFKSYTRCEDDEDDDDENFDDNDSDDDAPPR